MSTYTPIASQTLSAAAPSVTFSSIPQGYTDLVVVVNAICASGSTDVTSLQYNGDTSSGLYSSTRLVGNGSTINSDRQTGANFIAAGLINSTVRNSDIYQIQNYSNATTFKSCIARAGVADNQTRVTVGLWRNTNAITSLTISHASSINFSSGSTFSLYGIQVGDKAQKAQGGNIVVESGGYIYHAFTTSGTFIPSQAITADVLCVAGGGGGGGDMAGGGGAGGLLYQTGKSLTAKSYPVIVGAGGIGNITDGSSAGILATNGNDSVFGAMTAIGGGAGRNSGTGISGGSGGGSARGGAAGSATQGNSDGATGYGSASGASTEQGSGGGGAGAVGTNGGVASTGSGGAGGAGFRNSVIDAMGSATKTGEVSSSNYYYAGGGGGSVRSGSSGSAGAGGLGGGGAASKTTGGSNGVLNTGGGGGAGSENSANRNGGNGGSGIVIIRYLA